MTSQLIANALLSASLTSVVGIGFLIIFRVGKFFHFAHGAFFAMAPYLMFFLAHRFTLPNWLSAVMSLGVTIVLGLAVEFLCYQPLRKISNPANAMLLSSLGVFIVLQSTIALAFGSESKSLRHAPVAEGLVLLGARVTPVQIVIVSCAIVCLISVWAFARFTGSGKQIEAVSSDSDLALTVGVNVEGVYLLAMGLGTALAAIGGILTAYDVDITPTMGMMPLLYAVVAVIVGGGTVLGTAGGALLIGFIQHLGVIWLSSKWQDAIVFVTLLAFLILRPQGVTGRTLRKVTV